MVTRSNGGTLTKTETVNQSVHSYLPSPIHLIERNDSVLCTVKLLVLGQRDRSKQSRPWSRVYKTFFMLNSIEHDIFPAHIC